MLRLREGGTYASIFDVGPGDFVKPAGGRGWEKILSRSAEETTPARTWRVTTSSGEYGVCCIYAYAKACEIGDFEQLLENDSK